MKGGNWVGEGRGRGARWVLGRIRYKENRTEEKSAVGVKGDL